jgi:hypothetical protein
MTTPFTRVSDLTDNTFHIFLAKHDLVLVTFAWPWLPRVQKFSIVYEEVSQRCAWEINYSHV